MKVKLSLLASMGVLALVGAGCSSTTSDSVSNTDDTSVVSNEVMEVSGDTAGTAEVVEPTVIVETTATPAAYKAGDVVMVDLGYGWYEGKVEEFACDAGFYVRYKGLSASCITEDKLVKPVTPSADSLVVGAKVIANIDKGEMFGGKEIFPFYSGEITAVNASTYTVKDNSKKEREITIDKIYLK